MLLPSTIKIVACLALIVLVVAGKKRAWWLVGLAPIVALLAHRFALDPNNAFAVNDQDRRLPGADRPGRRREKTSLVAGGAGPDRRAACSSIRARSEQCFCRQRSRSSPAWR